jgi:hypothetical protein
VSPLTSSTPGTARAAKNRRRAPPSKGSRRGRRRTRAPTSASAPPDLRRRQGEDRADGVVELSQAGEAGREGDVVEGQRRGLDQQAGRLGPLRPGKVERSRPELFDEQPAQVSRAVGEPASEPLNAFAVDHAVGDETHRAAGHVCAQVPLW